jgi:hypothetical protein
MGVSIIHTPTAEDIGIALWALERAPRLGLTFHWSEGVKVRGWNNLPVPERAPFEVTKPAIRALLTPDASGRAGLDYIAALGPAPSTPEMFKPDLADKLAARALDHRGDIVSRAVAWRKLHQFGVLQPIEPRLPPPQPKPQARPDYRYQWREPKPTWPQKPASTPPDGFADWSKAWQHFRHKVRWHGERGSRVVTLWGFRIHVSGTAREWRWSGHAPNGDAMSGSIECNEAAAMGAAWAWMRQVLERTPR